MREFCVGVILDINLNMLPVVLVVPDHFTTGADRQKSLQGSDLVERRFEFLVQPAQVESHSGVGSFVRSNPIRCRNGSPA